MCAFDICVSLAKRDQGVKCPWQFKQFEQFDNFMYRNGNYLQCKSNVSLFVTWHSIYKNQIDLLNWTTVAQQAIVHCATFSNPCYIHEMNSSPRECFAIILSVNVLSMLLSCVCHIFECSNFEPFRKLFIVLKSK